MYIKPRKPKFHTHKSHAFKMIKIHNQKKKKTLSKHVLIDQQHHTLEENKTE